MASVWIADDPVLSRRVAVKILRDDLASDPSTRTRFRNEAIAAARLNHPNVVATYDTGDDDGTAYIVMELIDGPTVRQLLQERGLLPVLEVIRIGIGVAEALEAAHRAGLVHRDVKPPNVLVPPAGPREGDRLRHRQGDRRPRPHAHGDGDGHRPLPRAGAGQRPAGRRGTDVYALGLLLYEMLCGRPPFGGDTDVATAMARLTTSAAPIRPQRPDVPQALDDVVHRCLARDPARRYASAGAVRSALASVRINLQGTPPPPTPAAHAAARSASAEGTATGTATRKRGNVGVGRARVSARDRGRGRRVSHPERRPIEQSNPRNDHAVDHAVDHAPCRRYRRSRRYRRHPAPSAPWTGRRLRDDDADLASRASRGDRHALETLLDRHADRVHALCRRVIAHREDALDATQEAMIAIVRGIDRFDGRSAFTTWMYRVVTNAALDELRRKQRRPDPVDVSTNESTATPGPALDTAVSERLDVDAALASLPTDFRVAVVLRDLLDLDYAQIAEVLEIPAGTVRSRIARGRALLAATPSGTSRPLPNV